MRFTEHLSATPTPQTQAIIGREADMVANAAGGVVFKINDWSALDRFLILGTDGGTYYVSEKKLTKDNMDVVKRCVQADGLRVVQRIVEISVGGRAPSNDPALLALAYAMKKGDEATRKAAAAAVPACVRIGTHLFHFVAFIELFGGWGRSTKRAIGAWYTEMYTTKLALQLIKYKQRDGWSHRDVLRLAKPADVAGIHGELLRYTTKGWDAIGSSAPLDPALALVWAHEMAMVDDVSPTVLIGLITDYGLPWECVPSTVLDNKDVWNAILHANMGMEAMIRNLPKMTQVRLLAPNSDAAKFVASRLRDEAGIKASRIHPMRILLAMKGYAAGHNIGGFGTATWTPVTSILDALDAAFYLSFANVEPTGKRTLIALDVSSSMTSPMAKTALSCREASVAMALITIASEARIGNEVEVVGYTSGLSRDWTCSTAITPLAISARQRLDDVVRFVDTLHFGATDCALPFVWAKDQGKDFDAVISYTDSETYAGAIQPTEALTAYRKARNINTRAIVVGMTATEYSVLDEKDAGSMNVVGFDAGVPAVMADFIRG